MNASNQPNHKEYYNQHIFHCQLESQANYKYFQGWYLEVT